MIPFIITLIFTLSDKSSPRWISFECEGYQAWEIGDEEGHTSENSMWTDTHGRMVLFFYGPQDVRCIAWKFIDGHEYRWSGILEVRKDHQIIKKVLE